VLKEKGTMYDFIRNSTVLIVDDQPANLSILFDYLDDLNAKIFVAQDGEKALYLAEHQKPDIILLDIVMPGIDGYEVCKKLKEQAQTRDIPVIFISALSDTPNILKGFEMGGVDYITKPVQHHEAMARISTHLKIRHMEEELKQKEKLESLVIATGGIAHNFNNIMAVILAYAELLSAKMPKNFPDRHFLTKIINSIQRASDITTKMLTYTGKCDIITGNINLNAIIKEMNDILNTSVFNKSAIKYDLMTLLPDIKGDNLLIGQIIMELVNNSIEAMSEKEGIITLRTGVTEYNQISQDYQKENIAENLYVYIEVEDTGCGIDREIQNKIFDPFFTTRFIGRGLGLAVVQGIVKKHNGIITVKSDINKGTIIRINFPSLKN
jgi:signal transduction histidine kinase